MARLDPEKTAPFDLGTGPESCLLLHGFTGSPWEMRPLGEALAESGMRARGLRLPGHGTTPEAMAAAEGRDWLSAAREALEALATREPIFIAGLSMGALLAMVLAAERPEKVRGLALLAPAMGLRGVAANGVRALREWPLESLKPWVAKEGVNLADPKARAEAPVLRRFPLARLRDLFGLQDRAQAALSRIRAPSLVALGARDRVISHRAVRRLARELREQVPVRFVSLPQSAHLLPRDVDRGRLFEEIRAFFRAH